MISLLRCHRYCAVWPVAARVLVMAVMCVLALPARASLTLERVIALAQENDPWIRGSLLRQEAMEASSVAVGSLPDPMLSLGLANLPTDTFEFDQEAMTQFKVGLSQVFPRGDSRALRQRQLQLEAGEHPFRREERRARVAQEVSLLWLDSFLVSQTIALIEHDRNLFEHLVDVAESSYASARGAARQQDLIRAQLELTRLEDRLTRLDEQRAISTARLGEWIPESTRAMAISSHGGLTLPDDLPQLSLSRPELVENPTLDRLAAHLGEHPAILGLQRRIDASEAGVELAEQKYRPQWRIDASYGYRDDDPMGRDRADFFSLGVAFDLPLFTSSRQDREVQAAVASSEATRTDRALALRAMMAGFETQRSRLLRLEQRRQLYESRLLREMGEQAEASLTAYTNDDGDFSEVVRSRIDVLNARIDALHIEVDRLKTISQLNYFLTRSQIETTGEPQ